MQMTRLDRKDVTTIIYSIMTRTGLSVKFKMRLYTKDRLQEPQFCHQEYALPGDKLTVNLSPRSYIEFGLTIPNGDNAKVIIYITSIFLRRMVRMLRKIAQAFEAYDCGEVDFIVVDQAGTRIHKEIAKPINIVVGVQTLTFQPVYVDDQIKVGMQISAQGTASVLTVKEFLDLFYRLEDINFDEMNMLLMNYYNTMLIGTNRFDYRRNVVTGEVDAPQRYTTPMYNRIQTMGELIEIETPQTTNTNNKYHDKKPSW